MSSRVNSSRLVLCALCALIAMPATASDQAEQIAIDVTAPSHPFPHFWEDMFGSGRAVLALRDSYRQNLRTVQAATGFEYVRFHAIFHDDMGVYDEDSQGRPLYNFSYVDQVYDGLLANHVRPFVELSFMPRKLASDPAALHAFWYKQNVSPPASYVKWDALIRTFTQHLVDRYGIDEVAQWYFEVWNEPNIDFWVGNPKELTYYELYDHTARAVKQVNSRLRIGGPATAQAAWVDQFLKHCADNKVPVDFVSTHVYGNDSAENALGHPADIAPNQMVCPAVRKVHDQIRSSAFPEIPFIMSEFNASYANSREVTDSLFMGPWLADTIRKCDGLINQMSYWTFSDDFEEQGVIKEPFYGGYGLLAEGGIPKPAFNAFVLLHKLGTTRLENQSGSVLATRRTDGSLAVAVWNYGDAGSSGEAPARKTKEVTLHFNGLPSNERIELSRLDDTHGDVLPTYDKIGRPVSPTSKQLAVLKNAARLPQPDVLHLSHGSVTLTLPPYALFVIEVPPLRK